MPRYFFHVFDDIEAVDHEGLGCPDAEDAVGGAVKAARDWPPKVRQGQLHLDHRIEVVDGDGSAVATVQFRTATWSMADR
jgi:hypothetical protein